MAEEQQPQQNTIATSTQAPFIRPLLMLAALVVIILGMRMANSLLAPIFLDVVLAILFTPALRWLEHRGLPSSLALLVLVLILVAFLVFMIVILAISLSQLQARLPVYEVLIIQRTQALATFLTSKGINIKAGLKTNILNGAALIKAAIGTVTGVLNNLVGITFFLFLLFLMLAASKGLAQKVRMQRVGGNIFARHFAAYAHQIQTQYRIQAFSNLLSALAIMLELFLFRVDFSVLWGFLAFVLGFIPNVGLIIAVLPAVLIALILYGPVTALIIVIVTILLNAVMDNFVTPRFMGEGLNLSMLSIFLAFLLWSWVFGFLGALLAVPVTLLLRALFQSQKATRHLAVFLENVSAEEKE